MAPCNRSRNSNRTPATLNTLLPLLLLETMTSNMQLPRPRLNMLPRNDRLKFDRVFLRHQRIQRLDQEVKIKVSEEGDGVAIWYLGFGSRGGWLYDSMHS